MRRVTGFARTDIRLTAELTAHAETERYSVELETRTVNGRVRVDFPVAGRVDRSLRTTLGSGGARVRAVTRNGGIRIERR